MVIQFPLTEAQREQIHSVSDKKIRESQDALFMWLIERINDLEAQINAPALKSKKK